MTEMADQVATATATDKGPICDYCDQPAPWYERDSSSESPICKVDARDHYGSTWREMVDRIGPEWHKRQRITNA